MLYHMRVNAPIWNWWSLKIVIYFKVQSLHSFAGHCYGCQWYRYLSLAWRGFWQCCQLVRGYLCCHTFCRQRFWHMPCLLWSGTASSTPELDAICTFHCCNVLVRRFLWTRPKWLQEVRVATVIRVALPASSTRYGKTVFSLFSVYHLRDLRFRDVTYWALMHCSLEGGHRHFGRTYSLHLYFSLTLKMEAVNSSKMISYTVSYPRSQYKTLYHCSYYRILTMVYNFQKYWVFGLYPSSWY
jgi:hypothetical protein